MTSSNRSASTDLLGGDLKKLRLLNRISITEIARDCGISKQSVWRLEQPGHFATTRAAARYIAALDRAVLRRQDRTRALLRRVPTDVAAPNPDGAAARSDSDFGSGSGAASATTPEIRPRAAGRGSDRRRR